MQSTFHNRIIFALQLYTAIAAMFVGAAAQADTQVDTRPFIGFWEFPEAAGDKAVVIIKTGGQLSCFWTGSFSRAIEKGTWEAVDDGILATWDSGHRDLFRRIGDNAVERFSYKPGNSPPSRPDAQVRGVRIDNRLPGSLAVPRDSETAPRSSDGDEPVQLNQLRTPFLGFWRIPQPTGMIGLGNSDPFFYLRLTRNGHAMVALRSWNGDNAFRGVWEVDPDGNRIVITWPDQHKDVLELTADGNYQLLTFRPRDAVRGRPQDTRPATKVAAIDAERYFAAGEFKQLTVTDIRGKWVPRDNPTSADYVDIHGWGNAYRAHANGPAVYGKWRLQSDRVIINWDDGITDVLRIDFPRMVQESFLPGVPLTGVPMRSIEVVRR